MKSDDAQTLKIHKEYSEYLDKADIPYDNNQNGFHVYIPLKNIKKSFKRKKRWHSLCFRICSAKKEGMWSRRILLVSARDA